MTVPETPNKKNSEERKDAHSPEGPRVITLEELLAKILMKKAPTPKEEPDSKEKKTAPVPAPVAPAPRFVKYTSIYYHGVTHKIWVGMLLTLPVDLLLLSITPPQNAFPALELATTIIIVAAAIGTFVGFNRIPIIDSMQRFKKHRDEKLSDIKRYTWVFFVLIAVVALVEIIFKMASAQSIAQIFSYLVAFGVAVKSYMEYRESQALQKTLEEDRVAWVEHTNRHVFLVTFIPLIFVRLLSVALQVRFAIENTGSGQVPLLEGALAAIGTAVILYSLAPRHEDFVILCPRCSLFTSRALKDLGYCPRCNPKDFFAPIKPKNPPQTAEKKTGGPTAAATPKKETNKKSDPPPSVDKGTSRHRSLGIGLSDKKRGSRD